MNSLVRFSKFLIAKVKQFGLPLLAKELTEQSSRKRTYVIRSVYAAILFALCYLVFFAAMQSFASSPLSILGKGQDLIAWIVGIQFAGVYLFMPAMTCGVITQEKERDSLQLLFLTRLGPWAIVFEKLLGRIIPMLGFLFLSLPLLGVAYTLGGVSPKMLWQGVWLLVLATLQMGCLAILCSAFFRTTVASFLATYIIAFIMFFGPYTCVMAVMMVVMALDLGNTFSRMGPGNFEIIYFFMFPFFSPPIYLINFGMGGGGSLLVIILHSVINLGVCAVFLGLTRRFLVSRAFVSKMNFIRRALLARPTPTPIKTPAGEPVFLEYHPSEDRFLPANQPIIWRETKRGIFGPLKSRLWILISFEGLAILFGMGLMLIEAVIDQRRFGPAASMLSGPIHFMVWCLAVLIVAVKSASLISTERSSQTLDVLCTTPLTARQIIIEKMRSIWQLILLMAGPFLTMTIFKGFRLMVFENRIFDNYRFSGFDVVTYVVCQSLGFFILLPLTAWLSLWIGLMAKTHGRSIMGAMAAIMLWIVGPFILLLVLEILWDRPGGRMATSFEKTVAEVVMLASPATVPFANEINELKDFHLGRWPSIILGFSVFSVLAVGIRQLCLYRTDRWLGRLDSSLVANSPAANFVDEPAAAVIRQGTGGLESEHEV